MPIAFWVILAVLGVCFCAAGCGKGKEKSRNNIPGKAIRIDRMHYYDEDDHECGVCGARFRGKNIDVCPKCGVRFTGKKEDEEEFIEEMVIWDDDD